MSSARVAGHCERSSPALLVAGWLLLGTLGGCGREQGECAVPPRGAGGAGLPSASPEPRNSAGGATGSQEIGDTNGHAGTPPGVEAGAAGAGSGEGPGGGGGSGGAMPIGAGQAGAGAGGASLEGTAGGGAYPLPHSAGAASAAGAEGTTGGLGAAGEGGRLPGGGSAGAAEGASAGFDPVGPGPSSPCAAMIQHPVVTHQIPGIAPIEDITFDDAGYLYWNSPEGILRTTAGGETSLFVPGLEFFGGMRWAPGGDLYVANNSEGTLDRVTPSGEREVVLSGLDLNGVEVDREGRVYLSDFGGSRILRYDPATEAVTVLTDRIESPNGLSLSPDFHVLYFNSWKGSPTQTVYRLPLLPDGSAGLLENWSNNLGDGAHDGMAVDECGYVYVANSGGAGQIVRIAPDNPLDRVVVVERPGETLHNLAWGRGRGWSEQTVYIVSLEAGLFSADLGVRGKSYE